MVYQIVTAHHLYHYQSLNMKKIFLIIIILVVSFLFIQVQAQSKKFLVNGKAISSEGSIGLEGVSVHVKGMDQYTGSEPDGLFTIGVPKENNILVIELQGYVTQEITITSSKSYDIILKKAITNIQQKLVAENSSIAKQ